MNKFLFYDRSKIFVTKEILKFDISLKNIDFTENKIDFCDQWWSLRSKITTLESYWLYKNLYKDFGVTIVEPLKICHKPVSK